MLALAACDRAVEPEARVPAPHASPARCIAPLADPPPPAAAPADECPADPGRPSLEWARVRFDDAPDQPTIDVELADTPAEQARGLMYRTDLPEDQGMLFTFADEQLRSFWMRNTCVPLDLLFIDRDGFIVGILEQVPTLNTLPRGVPCPASQVLEVNAGWTRAHGVEPGQRLSLLP